MFWIVMYMSESIESTHRERVRFQGLNSMAFFTFNFFYFSSCSRFGAHIVSTVILTNYERTHKATRQSVWNRFYWQSRIGPPICAPFGTKSCMYVHAGLCMCVCVCMSVYVHLCMHACIGVCVCVCVCVWLPMSAGITGCIGRLGKPFVALIGAWLGGMCWSKLQ